MKHLLALPLALALACAASAASSKKAPKDPAFADTWNADAKGMTGKKVTTSVLGVGELGAVAGDAPVAIVPLVTGNTRGEEGGEILAVLPTKDMPAFVEKATKTTKGKGGAFGGKVVYPTATGTLATVEGELVLLIGAATPKPAGKPSELLTAQRTAASAGGTTEKAAPEEAKPAETKPAEDKKAKKKPAR